ncbi:MAG: response regulator transcription factor [Marinilabiliales bacterium]
MDNSSIKILLVDDENDILEFLGYNLKKEGYEIITANNGEDAIKQALQFNPDLIVLDIMMPGKDGVSTCEEMRLIPQLENTLIVFLTARGEDYSQIAGFEAGADDYITKPIKIKILISKIKALLRRNNKIIDDKDSSIIKIDNLTINKENYKVIQGNNEIYLPKKEFELLYLLASKPNKVFNRDEIYQKVWGDNIIVGDRTIDVHIRKLRKKIGDEFIKTIKGVGYKFNK